MKVHLLKGRYAKGYTTFGSVHAKGEVKGDDFLLKSSKGDYIPSQSRITAYWPDGSVKWAAHTANSSLIGSVAEIVPHSKGATEVSAYESANLNFYEDSAKLLIDNGVLKIEIPKETAKKKPLFKVFYKDEPEKKTCGFPVLRIEQQKEKEQFMHIERRELLGGIHEAKLVEKGPLQAVVRFSGDHEGRFPFVIYAYIGANSEEIRFTHTFIYDGEEEKDFLNGIGIRLITNFDGKAYNRHVIFGADGDFFHEMAQNLYCCRPRLSDKVFMDQLEGKFKFGDEQDKVDEASKELPVFNEFVLSQNADDSFCVKKRTSDDCCYLDAFKGTRAGGVLAAISESRSVICGIRNFWQKYPGALQVKNLAGDETEMNLWFYSPFADSFDFRHYDKKSYPASLYEGYEFTAPDAYGIANTSEFTIGFIREFPMDEFLDEFAGTLQNPPIYVADPEYYHEKKAFGYWSLKNNAQDNTYMEQEIQNQLDTAICFYENEIRQRRWYGFFDYGDVMHKYDNVRHVWRYDMGGFAWQNTELVPTYWLWLSFLRSGDGRIFNMAEAMTRHCSEVDMYHIGKWRGIGTRHNVRHWGCPCKEPRVSMAGHHRFYYYLTGDYRLKDIFDDVKDADKSMKNLKSAVFGISAENGRKKVSIRSGPDWTSFLANWMTAYEQTLDTKYLNKILTGIRDVEAAPFGLASGPEYLLDTRSGHLEYTGEHEDSINMHLQVCQGGSHIWLELMLMLEGVDDYADVMKNLLVKYGEFYGKSKEEKKKLTKGLIHNRPFSFPYFAAGLSSFSAAMSRNEELARYSIERLLLTLYSEDDLTGFKVVAYDIEDNGQERLEIPWISTNMVSQWSLNMILALEFVGEYFPKSKEELLEMIRSCPPENYKKG